MGCQKLNTDFFNSLEIIHPKKRVSEEKKRINYYPFGLKHKGYNNVVNGTDHKYGFGDKEENDELGLEWLDFSARNYDAAIGRWMNLDPLAENYYEWAPYNYAFNSPIIFTDPTGLGPIYDKDGNLIGYEVEEGQGPSQIAEDLNTIGLQAEVSHMDIVNSNPEKFEHIEDPTDVNDEGFTELDMNEGDIISVDSVVERENEITNEKNEKSERNENRKESMNELDNKIDSLSKEITKSHSQMESYNAMADFDRKYTKFSNEGIGPGAAYAISAARNEADSVAGVKKRKVMVKKRDSIKGTIENK